MQYRIPAGFPLPAEGYAEKGLDINDYLVRNKASTYFFRVVGDSMVGARIHDGDMLVVDRSILHSAAKFDPSRIIPVLLPIGMFIFFLSGELIW